MFDLYDVRWSIDPGKDDYNKIEQIIGPEGLWDTSQESPRWRLLTSANHHHSTITVNDRLHNVHGMATITAFDEATRSVILDVSEMFQGILEKAERTFTRVDAHTLRIEDFMITNNSTGTVMWAMITQAQEKTQPYGATLYQEGKQLDLKVIEPKGINISVVSLDPPPLHYDKRIEGLKRVELKVPAYMVHDNQLRMVVELSGREE